MNKEYGLTNLVTVLGFSAGFNGTHFNFNWRILTGLLIARERERGTLEALFVTPVRPFEIVLAKLIPYVVVGMIDIVICIVAAHFIFEVPMRGSLFSILFASFLYLIVSLLLGLTISGFAQSQFQASQIALLASFMPALMLSGFVLIHATCLWLYKLLASYFQRRILWF